MVSKLNGPWRQLFNIACKKMASSEKRQRVGYTLEFKMKVLEEVDKKRKKVDICSEFGIPKCTISTIISQRLKLEVLQQDAGLKRKRAMSAKYRSVDEAVLMWFKQCVAMNVPLMKRRQT